VAKKTKPTNAESQEQGEKLLTVVERLLDDTENLVALGDKYLSQARGNVVP
jgi:hypothetical protein